MYIEEQHIHYNSPLAQLLTTELNQHQFDTPQRKTLSFTKGLIYHKLLYWIRLCDKHHCVHTLRKERHSIAAFGIEFTDIYSGKDFRPPLHT